MNAKDVYKKLSEEILWILFRGNDYLEDEDDNDLFS